ncbi:hypothetical protein [Limimaricola soesokkakensis]
MLAPLDRRLPEVLARQVGNQLGRQTFECFPVRCHGRLELGFDVEGQGDLRLVLVLGFGLPGIVILNDLGKALEIAAPAKSFVDLPWGGCMAEFGFEGLRFRDDFALGMDWFAHLSVPFFGAKGTLAFSRTPKEKIGSLFAAGSSSHLSR